MTSAEPQRARRDVEVSLALAFPGSPVRGPIVAHLSAIDAELVGRHSHRRRGICLCSCGFGTDNPAWFEAHLFHYPGHQARAGGAATDCRETSPGGPPVALILAG